MLLKVDNPTDRCCLKFDSDDKTGEFEGYASVFNSNDRVNDTIAPGAFSKSLESGLPSMFINHKHGEIPVGDWIEMKQDDTGLFGRGKIDLVHKDGPTLYSAMKRQAMKGLSIGFTMNPDDFDRKEDGGRVIKNMELKEVSIVTFPCEEQAKILGVKAEDFAALSSLQDVEDWLRESAGFSKSLAVAFVSQFKRVVRGEPVAVAEKSKALESQIMRIINQRGFSNE